MNDATYSLDKGLGSFCDDVYPKLAGFLSLYTGERDLAQDLTQECLARACRDWKKVSKLQSPEGWVYRVAINLAKSHFRRLASERRVRSRLAFSGLQDGRQVEPAEGLAIRLAVSKLPRRQRTALILRFYLDLPVIEVAEIMGCAEGTVKALTSKGVDSLRRRLEPAEEEVNSVKKRERTP
jgi:RNA polymerase sigma factor (sigma-70 family)